MMQGERAEQAIRAAAGDHDVSTEQQPLIHRGLMPRLLFDDFAAGVTEVDSSEDKTLRGQLPLLSETAACVRV